MLLSSYLPDYVNSRSRWGGSGPAFAEGATGPRQGLCRDRAQTRPSRGSSSAVRLPYPVVWINYVRKRTEPSPLSAFTSPPPLMSSISECSPSGSGQETPEPRQDFPPSSSLPSQPFSTTQRLCGPSSGTLFFPPLGGQAVPGPCVGWKGACGASSSALSGPQCVTPQMSRLALSAGCGCTRGPFP